MKTPCDMPVISDKLCDMQVICRNNYLNCEWYRCFVYATPMSSIRSCGNITAIFLYQHFDYVVHIWNTWELCWGYTVRLLEILCNQNTNELSICWEYAFRVCKVLKCVNHSVNELTHAREYAVEMCRNSVWLWWIGQAYAENVHRKCTDCVILHDLMCQSWCGFTPAPRAWLGQGLTLTVINFLTWLNCDPPWVVFIDKLLSSPWVVLGKAPCIAPRHGT